MYHGEGKVVQKNKCIKGVFRFGKLIKRYPNEDKTIEYSPTLQNLENVVESGQGQQPNTENVNQNLNVEDEVHHIEKIQIGDTNLA